MAETEKLNFILFGGNADLAVVAKTLRDKGAKVKVFSDEMHLRQIIDQKQTLAQKLTELDFEFFSVEKLTVEQVQELVDSHTVGFSLSAIWIFSRELIELFQGRLYNMHTTSLPRYRGGGAYSWRIMAGDRSGGIVIHELKPGIDKGDIVLKKEFRFPDNIRKPVEYEAVELPLRRELLQEFIDGVYKHQGKLPILAKQEERLSSYWPRLNTPLHGYIDWHWSAQQIYRFICAFDDPYLGATTYWRGQKVRLKGAHYIADPIDYHPYQAGLIFHQAENVFHLACNGGRLLLEEIIDEHGNSLHAKVQLGDRLYTPSQDLEQAQQTRVIYQSTKVQIQS